MSLRTRLQKFRPRLSICLALFSALLMQTSLLAETVELAWKFSPGEAPAYRLMQTAVLSLSSEETAEVTASVVRTVEFNREVKEARGDDSALLSINITKFTLKAEGPGGQFVEYDSENIEDLEGFATMLIPTFKMLKETPLPFEATRQGDFKLLDLPELVLQSVKSGPGGKRMNPETLASDLKLLARLAGPQSLPAEEVEWGHSWRETRAIEMMGLGTAEATITYLVEQTDQNDVAKIGQTMSVVLDGESNGGSGKLTMVSEQSHGEISFDLVEGTVRSSKLDYEVEFAGSENFPDAIKLQLSTECVEVESP